MGGGIAHKYVRVESRQGEGESIRPLPKQGPTPSSEKGVAPLAESPWDASMLASLFVPR